MRCVEKRSVEWNGMYKKSRQYKMYGRGKYIVEEMYGREECIVNEMY